VMANPGYGVGLAPACSQSHNPFWYTRFVFWYL